MTAGPIQHAVLRECKYILLPGKCTSDAPFAGLYERAYGYWKQFWSKFYIENSLPPVTKSDDFLRQDAIATIVHGDEIVAMHLYNFFDLKMTPTIEHSYFQRSFNADYYQALARQGVRTVMSYEYLTVNENWRKSRTGISFANLCVGLGGRLQTALNIDSAVGISRSDVGVSQICETFGWKILVPGVEMNTKKCDLVAMFKDELKSHPDTSVRDYIDFFWQEKMDYTGLTQTIPAAIAA